jgi:hypothetical protein
VLLTNQHKFSKLRCSSAQALNGFGQAALMTSGFVFVDDVFIGDRVNGADVCLIDGFSRSFIAISDGSHDFLDRGAEFGTLRHIVRALFGRLLGALGGGFDVCHGQSRINSKVNIAKSITAAQIARSLVL